MVPTLLGPRLRWRLRATLDRHRRVVAAALVALAVVTALSALRPPSPAVARVLVARRDLPAGHRILPADLAPVSWARAALPAGLVAGPAGRVLAAPLRRGEPVTDVRVMSPGGGRVGPAGGPGTVDGRVVVAVRLTDPASALVAAPGDRVQVIAGPPLDPVAVTAGMPVAGAGGAPVSDRARVVVRDALVLDGAPPGGGAGAGTRESPSSRGGLLGALDPAGGTDAAGGGSPAGVLTVAVSPGAALDLAAVAGVRTLTVARTTPRPG